MPKHWTSYLNMHLNISDQGISPLSLPLMMMQTKSNMSICCMSGPFSIIVSGNLNSSRYFGSCCGASCMYVRCTTDLSSVGSWFVGSYMIALTNAVIVFLSNCGLSVFFGLIIIPQMMKWAVSPGMSKIWRLMEVAVSWQKWGRCHKRLSVRSL